MNAITKVWEFPRRFLVDLFRTGILVYIALTSWLHPPAPLTSMLRFAFLMHRGKNAPICTVTDVDEDGLSTVTIQLEVSCFSEDDIEVISKSNDD